MRSRLPRHAAALALALALAACASFNPHPIETIPFKERAQTQTRHGITVTAAVPSRDEARKVFGIDLEKKGIQPVWVHLENASEIPYAFMLTGVDPNYFSAHEAAYKSHFRLRSVTNAKIDAHFDQFFIPNFLPPQGDTEGFVFTNLKLGTKEVRIRLFGPKRIREFEFYISVPGFKADYHEVDWDELAAQEWIEYQEELAFRDALRALPCCTTRADGSGEGDPLNLIILGSPEELGNSLIRAGWDETERLTFASGWRTFKAFFGGEYKYSPMSSLYVYGRGQDAGYQKARDTIHERNHLRLWLSPMKFRGEHVWVGTITRDIGVYFTTRAWNLTTHAIDPYVDESREYLREDFKNAQSLERFGFVEGAGAATKEEPHRNLMNAPWWTDGLRLVMEVSKQPRPMDQVSFFYWDWPRNEGEEVNERLRRLAEE
jgi:hypothetical protein